MTKTIKQSDREGLYTSDIIGGRYQVLESDVFRGSYFVYDLIKDDMIRSRDGSCKYFEDVASAMTVAEGSTPAETTKVRAKQLKVTSEPTVKPVKVVKEKPVATEPKAKRPSANTMIIELIKTTKLSDEEISVEVLKVFPDCKTTKPYDVKYRRRKVEAGEL
jgi:hypothetical protein